MNASIYSMNHGTEVAFQYGNSRAVKPIKCDKGVSGWSCQILKDGVWIATANRWQQIVSRTERALKA